jgi:hypothetical protein
MTDAKKILDMAMEKPFSEFCFNIIQFQNSHTELMVTSYLPYVKLFEDHLESLCKNIQELNLSKGELEESHAVQALFLVRVPRTLFSAFQQAMKGDYYESMATCRIAYESMLRILFIQKYPSDWASTLLHQKGMRQFKASKFISEDLKIAEEDKTYNYLSFPIHSQKQFVLGEVASAITQGGITLSFGYEFNEREMAIAFNYLLALLYFAFRLFLKLFGRLMDKEELSAEYPIALETYLKEMPNRFSGYSEFIDKALEAAHF